MTDNRYTPPPAEARRIYDLAAMIDLMWLLMPKEAKKAVYEADDYLYDRLEELQVEMTRTTRQAIAHYAKIGKVSVESARIIEETSVKRKKAITTLAAR